MVGQYRVTSLIYDAQGNVLERTEEGFEAGAAFSLTTVNTYTAEGRLETTDPPGDGTADTVVFDYTDPPLDPRGNLLLRSRTDPLVGTTTYEYDAFNRQEAVTDPNGLVVHTVYDAMDRVVETTVEGSLGTLLVTENRYDEFGDLFQTVMPEGNVVEYSYDHAGRLETIERKPDDQPSSHGERTRYEYDAAGNRTREEQQGWDQVTQSWVTATYTIYDYASRCHLASTEDSLGNLTEYAYDCDSRLEAKWNPDNPSLGQTATPSEIYTYDLFGRLATVSAPWANSATFVTTSYDYDVQDHLDTVTDAEGNVTTYVYSDRDLLTSETSIASGTKTHAYDAGGNLTSTTDARSIQTTRVFDVADRVTQVTYPTSSLDVTYGYDQGPDALGRLSSITRGGATLDFTYDEFGRQVQDGDLAYGYDDTLRRATGEAMETADRPLAGDRRLSTATGTRSPIPPVSSPTTTSTTPTARSRSRWRRLWAAPPRSPPALSTTRPARWPSSSSATACSRVATTTIATSRTRSRSAARRRASGTTRPTRSAT
ncbi:MAG: RHS repeat protein [Acidobacteria bacterium]|mgnify:CR=1 FL=1|nr:MAG: RHS repeat protein [Acidobacteriota bacterium]